MSGVYAPNRSSPNSASQPYHLDSTEQVNILLVDDHPENLLALEGMLGSLGQSLVKATSGQEALKCILDQDFAVILLDIKMPGIDGFEIASLIKEREQSQHTPIIFITAIDQSEEEVYKGYSVGAVDYLFKPIVPEILRAKVATFVELYRKTKQVQRQAERIEAVNRELGHQLREVKRLNRELEQANKLLETEVTERQHAQEALQRSEKLYRTLAQNLPQTAVFLFDHDLRYIIAEGTLLEQVGNFSHMIEGKTIWQVMTPELCDFWVPYYQATLNGTHNVFEKSFGDRIYFIQVIPVKNERDEIFAGLGMIQDITELKQTELALREMNDQLELRVKERTAELKASNEELTTFTNIVSHDLRSPLVNLKGFTDELRSAIKIIPINASEFSQVSEEHMKMLEHTIQKDIPEAMNFIDAAVERMDSLTSALLRLARLGRRELNPELVDMDALAEMILNSLAHQVKQKAVRVEVGQLPWVWADRTAMEQIVGNIITNAVLYLRPDCHGEIEITGEAGDFETVFQVRDNGRGIAEEDRQKVFEPFRRVGKSEVSGEGMGLAYVQVLVRRHGGRIWYTSELGIGTTFYFSIPNIQPE